MNTIVEHAPAHVSVPIYWSLPGPAKFLTELIQTFDLAQAFVVRIENPEITGVRKTIGDALRKACHEPERIQFLDVHEGSHLESDIGHHFGKPKLSAMQLASWSAPPKATVVLTPHSSRARERCRVFYEEFVAEVADQGGNCIRLVLLWNEGDDPLAPKSPKEVRFNGSLTEDEMHAYVTLRMVGSQGLGTSSLARHLVIEFAGSDPLLAEELMTLHPNALLELPNTLARLPPRHGRAPRGTDAVSDWLEMRAQSTAAADANKRLEQRYWRACVRALLPWIEERRMQVIEKLRWSLEDYLYPTKGVWKKRLPYRVEKYIDIPIEELEFNDIVAMSRQQNGDPFKPLDAQAETGLACCRAAKRVRDALAHLRAPAAGDIRDMVRLLDELLQGPSVCSAVASPRQLSTS
ncbi:hypothetical protein [Achromobacter xylosoxidans]|uniref:hypothetical protein n=1 Tax=Alcaligenes xylosoxydans xylosoxydans TaxID=85698 RepID=UPI001564061E|nr:hypothetical protein [Achromobacter xylosoxidans]QKI70658.1 hypothetical protein HPS44_13995 [Achromobacter xylosoxidans]